MLNLFDEAQNMYLYSLQYINKGRYLKSYRVSTTAADDLDT